MAMENQEKKGPEFGELQPLFEALQKRFLNYAKDGRFEPRLSPDQIMPLIKLEFYQFLFESYSAKLGRNIVASMEMTMKEFVSPTVASPSFARVQLNTNQENSENETALIQIKKRVMESFLINVDDESGRASLASPGCRLDFPGTVVMEIVEGVFKSLLRN